MKVRILRSISSAVVLVSLLLVPAGFSMAASLDTVARVHLVRGVQAQVAMETVGVSREESPNQVLLRVTGPASHHVDIQLAALNQGASWSDAAPENALSVDSCHDPEGNLVLDMPLAPHTPSPGRYILCLTYE